VISYNLLPSFEIVRRFEFLDTLFYDVSKHNVYLDA